MDLVNQIQWDQPHWFLLIPIGLLVYIFICARRYEISFTRWLYSFSRIVYRHPLVDHLAQKEKAADSGSRVSQFFGLANILILLCLFSLSLVQPYRIGKKLPTPPEHRDIVFLVDTSVSMVLRDYLVNGTRTQRMDVLKNVLTHFVDQLRGNRIQIVAYSEQAYTLVPLTTDYELIKHQLRRLEPASLTGRSSDLSLALLYALKPYKDRKVESDSSPVFVMLTDAHRPVRKIDPVVAAEYVSQHDIRLHTIAIGAGSYEAEEKDRTSLVYHPTSFLLLEKIADRGKGKFFWAKDEESLKQALVSINEAEKIKINREPEFVRIPLYQWPLFAALVYLMLLYLSELYQIRLPGGLTRR